MIRFGSSHVAHDVTAQVRSRVAPSPPAAVDLRSAGPTAGEVIFEIGLILSLHLAFAAVVILTLKVFGAA